MSGGSFDYLYSREADEILANSQHLETLEDMAHELVRYGVAGEKARVETLRLREEALKLRAQIDQLNEALKPLYNVWRMAEYRRSNDVGEDSVIESLADFNTASISK